MLSLTHIPGGLSLLHIDADEGVYVRAPAMGPTSMSLLPASRGWIR